MNDDLEEKKIYCEECNGYLWSVSIHEEGPEIIECPYQRDPCGECTGKPKRRATREAPEEGAGR